MIERPKVSVVITIYNGASYLEASVRSVLSQTLKEIEIILVDDGSSDDSVSKLKKLAEEDERILLYEQGHKGRPSARNAGLDHASGEFVYFMNCSDELDSDALEYAYKFTKKRQLDFVFFDGDVVGGEEANGIQINKYHRSAPYNEIIVYKGLILFDDMLDNGTYRPVPWLLFIRRVILQEAGIRFYPGIVHDDELFTALLFIQSDRVGCIRRSLVRHRIVKEFLVPSSQMLYHIRCYLTVLDELFAYAGRFPYLYPHIRKYASITLNRVFKSIHQISFSKKIRATRLCLKAGYLRYIEGSTLIGFWFRK